MTNEELRSSTFPLIWDNTMRATGKQCQRKFYWFLRGYDFKGKPAYFTWGGAWHEMLRHWYHTPHPEDPKDNEFWECAKASLAVGRAYYDNEIFDAEVTGDNSRANLEPIFVNYLVEHPTEAWKPIKMGEEGGEFGWEYPIAGSDYSLGGSTDDVIEWPSYGMLIREDKTTGSYLTDNYIGSWSLSGQISGYIWYLTQIIGPDEVFGCLVNMVTKKKPGPKSSWKTPRTARSLEKRSKLRLEKFIEDFLWDIEEFKRCWNEWRWPMTPDITNCFGGVGKAPCLFRNTCLLDTDYTTVDPSQFQEIGLRQEAWEPWKRKGEQL
jgi:hypothetical protein